MKEKHAPYIPIRERMGMPLIIEKKVSKKGGLILSVVCRPSLDQQLEHARTTFELDRPEMISDLLTIEDPHKSREDKDKARARLITAFRQAKIVSAAMGIEKEKNGTRVYQPSVEMKSRWKIMNMTLQMGGSPDQARRFSNMLPRHTKGVQRIEIREHKRRKKKPQRIALDDRFISRLGDLRPAS